MFHKEKENLEISEPQLEDTIDWDGSSESETEYQSEKKKQIKKRVQNFLLTIFR